MVSQRENPCDGPGFRMVSRSASPEVEKIPHQAERVDLSPPVPEWWDNRYTLPDRGYYLWSDEGDIVTMWERKRGEL